MSDRLFFALEAVVFAIVTALAIAATPFVVAGVLVWKNPLAVILLLVVYTVVVVVVRG